MAAERSSAGGNRRHVSKIAERLRNRKQKRSNNNNFHQDQSTGDERQTHVLDKSNSKQQVDLFDTACPRDRPARLLIRNSTSNSRPMLQARCRLTKKTVGRPKSAPRAPLFKLKCPKQKCKRDLLDNCKDGKLMIITRDPAMKWAKSEERVKKATGDSPDGSEIAFDLADIESSLDLIPSRLSEIKAAESSTKVTTHDATTIPSHQPSEALQLHVSDEAICNLSSYKSSPVPSDRPASDRLPCNEQGPLKATNHDEQISPIIDDFNEEAEDNYYSKKTCCTVDTQVDSDFVTTFRNEVKNEVQKKKCLENVTKMIEKLQ